MAVLHPVAIQDHLGMWGFAHDHELTDESFEKALWAFNKWYRTPEMEISARFAKQLLKNSTTFNFYRCKTCWAVSTNYPIERFTYSRIKQNGVVTHWEAYDSHETNIKNSEKFTNEKELCRWIETRNADYKVYNQLLRDYIGFKL